MHDRELYRQILGIQVPWEVSEVASTCPATGVTVHSSPFRRGSGLPGVRRSSSGYDTRERKWPTSTPASTRPGWSPGPRVPCPEHGVHQLPVPWAESNSRLTALFEALVIDWLKIGTIS